MTRSSYKWKDLPGNYDRVNAFGIFPSSNVYGIPDLDADDFVPEWLVPYGQRVRTDTEVKDGAIHTFLDDYRFETLWTRPWDNLKGIKKLGGALSPDFSTYVDWPFALQLWNVYRNRWLGAFWQSHLIKVIPTVSWAGEESYNFAFLGVPKEHIVAISTVGVNRRGDARESFVKGFEEMMKQLNPKLILCYGEKAPIKLEEYTIVKWYPSYWKSLKDARKSE